MGTAHEAFQEFQYPTPPSAIYPEDVITHHRAFIACRRSLRPSEEYREPTVQEWRDFLDHFELRKVALGVCARDFGTPCVHEHACFSELSLGSRRMSCRAHPCR